MVEFNAGGKRGSPIRAIEEVKTLANGSRGMTAYRSLATQWTR